MPTIPNHQAATARLRHVRPPALIVTGTYNNPEGPRANVVGVQVQRGAAIEYVAVDGGCTDWANIPIAYQRRGGAVSLNLEVDRRRSDKSAAVSQYR